MTVAAAQREELAGRFEEFFSAVDRLIEQDSKKIEISNTSLEISSEELRTQHANLDAARRQIEHMLGIPVPLWMSDPDVWEQRLHPSDRRWAGDDYRRALTREGTWTAEYRIIFM